MFELKIQKQQYTVKTAQGLEVTVEPLSMSAQNDLLTKNTRSKGGGRMDTESGLQLIETPDINYLEQNIQVAQKSWKSWNCKNGDSPVPCNDETIKFLFDFRNDSANEVLTELDKAIKEQNKKLSEEKKT